MTKNMNVSEGSNVQQLDSEAVSAIFNDVFLESVERPETILVSENGTAVTMAARLNGIGWTVNTFIRAQANSVSISVTLQTGFTGYTTDILNRFVTEDVIREYALHARASIALANGLSQGVVDSLNDSDHLYK